MSTAGHHCRPPTAEASLCTCILQEATELNREYAHKWPNITAKKDMSKDARAYRDETGKFDKYFSPKPGGIA